MLIDMHAHSSAVSRCCRIDIYGVLEQAKKHGMDGVTLTNHYAKKDKGMSTPLEQAERYVREIENAARCAELLGMRIFYGIEVTSEPLNKAHMLVYGVPKEFILEHPTIYDYTQKELYDAIHAAGGILVHAHPYRGDGVLSDVTLLDGVEINCHPLYDTTHSEEMIRIARQNGLLVTCGGDFHNDTKRVKCGMYLPDEISDSIALKDYLLTADTLKLCITEIGDSEAKTVYFNKTKK